MNDDITLAQATELAKDLFARFQFHNERPWGIEALLMELQAEVGTLADTVMQLEHFRKIRDNQTIDLPDDLSDVMFILLLIADHYKINLGSSYKQMISLTLESVKKRHEQ